MTRILTGVVLAVLLASRAQAAPITVSAGDFLTFNFDLSGATPPPPYTLAGVFIGLDGLDFAPCGSGLCDLLDIGVWNFYSELDGGGSPFFTYPVNLEAVYQTEMLDGVFSATLQMLDGAIIVDPVVCGIAADGTRTSGCPAGPLPPATPEPATMTLLAFGAAAAMLARRAPRRPARR